MEDGLIHECKEPDTTDSEQGMPGKLKVNFPFKMKS